MEAHVHSICGCHTTILVSAYFIETYASPHSAPFDDDNPEDLNLHPHKSSLPTQSQKCPTRTEDQAREKNNGAMLSFHNSTLHCEGCRGESYWVSFHERSFFRGRRFKLYRGIINGKGPYVGDRCVVKVFANQYGTENHCCQEVLKSEQLRKLIHAFNQRLNQNQIKKPHRLRATRSYWAPIDEVSKLKSLFFSGHKNLSVGEGVVFEQDLRVSEYSTKKCKYVTEFVDQSGIWFDGNYSQIINAFIHFTYDYTGGNLVVCGLNGVKDESGYFLSTPTIHTKTLEFGQTDGGLRGIHDVMKNHTCGHLCQELSIDRRPSMPHSLHIGIEVKTSMSEPIPAPSIVPDDNTDSWSQQQHFSTDPQIFYSPSSHASVFTENNTPFSEPSAPEMEDIGDVIIPPPPYSRAQEARVAYWIIGEESGNRFLHNSPSLPVPCGSARLGSSVECQSAHNTCNSLGSKDLGSSVPSTTHTHESESTSPNNTAHIPPSPTQCQDINANFMCHNNPGTEPRSDIISVSELSTHHPEPGMVTEEIKIESKTVGDPAVDRNKRVRFEDPAAPNYQKTPTAPSVFTGLSDDVTMDTWTSASISSSPSMAVRSQFQHYRQRQDSMCTDSSAHAPSVAGTDVCPRELPPPYTLHDPTQSQLTTAYWLLRRNGYEMHSFRPPVFAPWEVRVTTANNNNNNTSNNNNNSNNNEDNNNNNNDFNYLAWIKK